MTTETDNGFKADRRRISFRLGEYISNSGEIFKITQIINFDELVGISIKSGQASRLLITNLKAISTPSQDEFDNKFIHRDLEEFSDDDWKEIERRFNLITPLVNGASKSEIVTHAKQQDVHYTTLYRWFKNYQATGTLTGLLPQKNGRKPNTLLVEPRVEAIIEKVIEDIYLNNSRAPIDSVIKAIFSSCDDKKLNRPSESTIRRRINNQSEYHRTKRRHGSKQANTKFAPAPGEYVADYPLQIVQIDHTPVDLILVDDEHRLPIGRPFITVAIDIYSRMITGYYLSLEPPSTTSVAMCVAHSINPKDHWLILHNVESSWPVWGFMTTIHTDNGAEFRSETLQRACLTHDINLEYRPVKSPNFGGHIERLIGTVMKSVHSIPGTTFSNIKEKAEYDSDGNACMTFSEFEKWLVTWITKVYHKRKHSTLGMSPEDKWNEGIFGSLHSEGIGYMPKPNNPETILIDFLPMVKRTVQKNGVNIDGLNYYDNVLRQFIRVVDKKTNKNKQFIFRQDPRDISYVWFYESIEQKYYKIPLANQAIPNMTSWELLAIKKRIKEKNYTFSEYSLITVHEEMRGMIEDSTKKTKKARRMSQKLKNNENPLVDIAIKPKLDIPAIETDDDIWDEDIPEFD
jgi:putative transposase